MAGRGPAPKPAHRRAHRGAEPCPPTVLEFRPGVQPKLPAKAPGGLAWPVRTREWWAMWGRAPQSELFAESDWSELLDTALLHARLWRGEVSVAPELRLRVAKFGATPEDRARLRIQFAQADEADAKRPAAESASDRFGKLKAVE